MMIKWLYNHIIFINHDDDQMLIRCGSSLARQTTSPMGGFSILRLERSDFTIYNENASNYEENIAENDNIDYSFWDVR